LNEEEEKQTEEIAVRSGN